MSSVAFLLAAAIFVRFLAAVAAANPGKVFTMFEGKSPSTRLPSATPSTYPDHQSDSGWPVTTITSPSFSSRYPSCDVDQSCVTTQRGNGTLTGAYRAGTSRGFPATRASATAAASLRSSKPIACAAARLLSLVATTSPRCISAACSMPWYGSIKSDCGRSSTARSSSSGRRMPLRGLSPRSKRSVTRIRSHAPSAFHSCSVNSFASRAPMGPLPSAAAPPHRFGISGSLEPGRAAVCALQRMSLMTSAAGPLICSSCCAFIPRCAKVQTHRSEKCLPPFCCISVHCASISSMQLLCDDSSTSASLSRQLILIDPPR